MLKPDIASNCTDRKSTDPCSWTVGDKVRLKGFATPMVINCVYRHGTETRVKTQWNDSRFEGFMDLDITMIERALAPDATYTLNFKCACEKPDLSTIVFDGLAPKCKACGWKQTVVGMMVTKNFPELEGRLDQRREELKDKLKATEEQGDPK
jgi:hypothetical protein